MTDKDTAQDQARAQYESIVSMLEALDVDYDRLQELRNMKADHEIDMTGADDPKPFNVAHPDEAEELEELEEAAGDCESEDEARERIEEDPLEVSVRSGWQSRFEDLEAVDFRILLCTGGTAVQIRGELDDNNMPCRAWIEYQDWGTPWTQYFGADQQALIRYASHFFG